MFPDVLWPQLLLLAAGQTAACLQLRSGRFWPGAAATLGLWALADLALFCRLLLGVEAMAYRAALAAMQVLAVLVVLQLLLELWRRRAARPQRSARYAVALRRYLAGELTAAAAELRGMLRRDPWDAAAWLLLGNVLRRRGETRAAERCYRRAAAVDRAGLYRGLLRLQRERVARVGPATLQQGPQPVGKAAAAKGPQRRSG